MFESQKNQRDEPLIFALGKGDNESNINIHPINEGFPKPPFVAQQKNIQSRIHKALEYSGPNLEKKDPVETPHASSIDAKEGGYIGTKLGELYEGYFSKPKVAEVFLEDLEAYNILEKLPEKVKILGIGSGPGLVEIMTYRFLKEKHNKKPELILSDKEERALDKHYKHCEPQEREDITKEIFDGKEIPYEDETFDLILIRSVQHYEKSKALQEKFIQEAYRVLKKGGFLLNQEVAFNERDDALLLRKQRELVGKKTFYLTKDETLDIHKKIFGTKNVHSEKAFSMPMSVEDYKKRFSLDNKPEIIDEILDYIEQNKRKIFSLIFDKDKKYFSSAVPFDLIVAEKKKS